MSSVTARIHVQHFGSDRLPHQDAKTVLAPVPHRGHVELDATSAAPGHHLLVIG